MKKRLIPLLVLSVVLTSLAPLAMADHCFKCNLSGTLCRPASTGGRTTCSDVTGTCVLGTTACSGPHPFVETPLAAEFTVVSVERLDEAQPDTTETRVASLATTETVQR